MAKNTNERTSRTTPGRRRAAQPDAQPIARSAAAPTALPADLVAAQRGEHLQYAIDVLGGHGSDSPAPPASIPAGLRNSGPTPSTETTSPQRRVRTKPRRRGERAPLESAGLEAVSGALDGGQRQQILDTLITVLDGAYAHLPAKRAAYAVDPVQELKLLRLRAGELSNAEFHLQVTRIVAGLRDAHTRYIGPSPLRGAVAALPFLVEQYGSFDDPHFLVTKTAPGVLADVEGGEHFRPGAIVESWNGVPIGRAVDIHADREAGGRPDARRASALQTLTFRALDYGPPPDEHWVVVGYRDGRTRREIRMDWRVVRPGKAQSAAVAASRTAAKQAIHPTGEAIRRAKKLLFAPGAWSDETTNDSTPVPVKARPTRTGLIDTTFSDNLTAQRLAKHKAGYLRIWSFDVEDDDAFLGEVQRLLEQLPQERLIVDLRANPGGLIWAAERLLQLFADGSDRRRQPIQPTRFSLVASQLTREMAGSPFNRLELESWSPSLDHAISTGEQYAQPLPLTDPEWCNDLAYHYPGKAVAVVDATTYSSGDLFAAGWVDNSIGDLVVAGRATGGGGANVWTGAQLRDALTGTSHAYRPLPAGVGFTVAIRRAIRSAASDGIPIEDLGIPGISYDMTRTDLEHGNRDLLTFCADLLHQRT